MERMERRKIFAVDDEDSIRELYSCALEGADFETKCFENGDLLFSALQSQSPDLIILDIMLDGMDGYKILAKLKQDTRFENIPVIMVSAKGEEINKVKGLNLGADDYLAKPFGVLELIARVKANLRKLAKNSSPQNCYKDINIDENLHKISIKNECAKLTLKEYNLLKLLVENAGKTLDRDAILNAIWGEDYVGDTRTLDTHIKDLRKVLSEKESDVVISTIRGVGFLLE
ncbi:MAG: response regulator transcription factor [Clostridia bacterium]